MSAEHLQAHLRQVSVCHQPIFIIGSPRSGTTILAQALAKHSELWFSLESNILHTLFGNGEVDKALERAIKRPQRTWLVQEGVDRDEFLGFLGLGINALYTNRSQGRRWIDKTPIYTLMADVLAAMFPDAFFVHILRDGRRVVQSMAHFLNRFNIDHVADVLDADMEERAFILPWGINFRGACRTWSLYANTAMDFCARHPTRCLTVINEELVADPQKGFRDIFDFVGVPPEEAPVDLFQGRRVNSSFSQPSTKPLSINELSEPWNEWTLDQKDVFLREAGQTLQKYGFVTQDELRQMESEVNSTSRVHQLQRKVVKTAPSRAKSEEAPGSRLSYPKLVERIREVVVSTAPTNATVLVVSKGEATLTRLIGRQAWHFPQDEDGKYSGYYPADSQDAIAHLEALRAKGAD
ncbi:MAG: hypothetical protein AVDCRST_MAG93-7572, partial [uncultured Chloroflexia bacterium]